MHHLVLLFWMRALACCVSFIPPSPNGSKSADFLLKHNCIIKFELVFKAFLVHNKKNGKPTKPMFCSMYFMIRYFSFNLTMLLQAHADTRKSSK